MYTYLPDRLVATMGSLRLKKRERSERYGRSGKGREEGGRGEGRVASCTILGRARKLGQIVVGFVV